MDCIYIAPLSKALYNLFLSFTHSHTHSLQLAAMQGTNQLVRSNRGLGVSLRDTSTCPGWDRTGKPPAARRQLLPPERYRPPRPPEPNLQTSRSPGTGLGCHGIALWLALIELSSVQNLSMFGITSYIKWENSNNIHDCWKGIQMQM